MSKLRAISRRGLDAAVKTLALFALANLLLAAFSERWDPTWLWVQGGALPSGVVLVLAILFAVGVLCPRGRHPMLSFVVRSLALLLSVACLADAFVYYRLLMDGRIGSDLPVPLSLLLAVLLLAWSVSSRPASPYEAAGTRRALWVRVLDHTAPLWLGGIGLLLHIVAVGATHHVKPADAAIVYGAAVRANGKASRALRDRTLTACDLYHRGIVKVLVLSGGRDPKAPLSEPACMALLCIDAGVPEDALILDELGVDTRASVRTARALAAAHEWDRVLMVSHDYHLARIQIASHQAGLKAATYPAHEPQVLLKKPWFTLRELPAIALYLLRP